MAGEISVPPPEPLVKVPKILAKPPTREYKVGRGYSLEEIKAVGLTERQARLLGIYVDKRRKSTYEINVQRLKEWLEKVKKGEIQPPQPTLPKIIKVKLDKSKVFRGKTSAGRKMRGLIKEKYRRTLNYKIKKKLLERKAKKRHEAVRHKGGH